LRNSIITIHNTTAALYSFCTAALVGYFGVKCRLHIELYVAFLSTQSNRIKLRPQEAAVQELYKIEAVQVFEIIWIADFF
jgi:hypothetical protein